jgi:hypothetical protein
MRPSPHRSARPPAPTRPPARPPIRWLTLDPRSWDFYGVGLEIWTRPIFYLVMLLAPIGAITYDLVVMHIRRTYFPGARAHRQRSPAVL